MKILTNFNNYEYFLILYIAIINIITFIAYGIDKSKAQNKQWRISEFTLIFLGVIGGGVGGLMAMVIFKHKLSKALFYIGLPVIIVVNKIMELAILSFLR